MSDFVKLAARNFSNIEALQNPKLGEVVFCSKIARGSLKEGNRRELPQVPGLIIHLWSEWGIRLFVMDEYDNEAFEINVPCFALSRPEQGQQFPALVEAYQDSVKTWEAENGVIANPAMTPFERELELLELGAQ